MFVRLKTIKGKPYAYLVTNEWTPWGSRQKVTKYLGRAHHVTRTDSQEHSLAHDFHTAINTLITQELLNHGFQHTPNGMTNKEITVNIPERTVRTHSKDVVLNMNEGFLCTETLTQLHEYNAPDHPEKAATQLAEHLLEAGLKPTHTQFEHLFNIIWKRSEHF